VNHVIVLTPPGSAAIAVIRITGEKTAQFLRSHFSHPVTPQKQVHGTLSDGDRVIDDPVVVLHAGGGTADLCVHGGPWVVRQVLELARADGFQSAQDLSAAVAQDGRDDIERNVLANLPLARTELAIRWLLAWARQRRRGGAPMESDRSLWWLLHPPRVAIVGAPNVGKSTLANQLFGQERSIVADVPGTTRDWVGEVADIDGLAVFLVDTPGLRRTDDQIERAAIAGSGPVVRSADDVVLVVDGSAKLSEQRKWAEEFPHALVVRNKCDLAKTAEPIDAATPHVHTIASKGYGIDAVRQAIRRRFVQPWPSVRVMS